MAEKNLYSETFQTGDIKYKGCSDQIKDLRRDVMNKEIGDAMIRDVLSWHQIQGVSELHF
jgi:hypothetical protein